MIQHEGFSDCHNRLQGLFAVINAVMDHGTIREGDEEQAEKVRQLFRNIIAGEELVEVWLAQQGESEPASVLGQGSHLYVASVEDFINRKAAISERAVLALRSKEGLFKEAILNCELMIACRLLGVDFRVK